MPPEQINELSAFIGRFENALSSQSVTNTRILDEIRSINIKMNDYFAIGVEVRTELREYRKTLHDRFDRIHGALAAQELEIHEHDGRLKVIELRQAAWAGQFHFGLAVVFALATATAPIVGYLFPLLIKLLH